MAATASVYGLALGALASKAIDWSGDTIKVALCDNTYTPAQDTHQYASDLTGELTDASYARQTLASKTSTYDAASNALKLSAANPVFTALTGTFRYAVFIDDTGTAGTSRLLGWTDFGADQVAAGVDTTLTVGTSGIFTIDTP